MYPLLVCNPNLMHVSPLGEPGVGKTAAIHHMLGKLEGPGGFDIKYGSILGDVLLYNEIKKSRLYILNSKFYSSCKMFALYDLGSKSII